MGPSVKNNVASSGAPARNGKSDRIALLNLASDYTPLCLRISRKKDDRSVSRAD
jgi:hypothetical protein